MEHREMMATGPHVNHDTSHVTTSTRQDVSQVVGVVKKTEAAKEMEEENEVPKLGINQTSQEWEMWRSS